VRALALQARNASQYTAKDVKRSEWCVLLLCRRFTTLSELRVQ